MLRSVARLSPKVVHDLVHLASDPISSSYTHVKAFCAWQTDDYPTSLNLTVNLTVTHLLLSRILRFQSCSESIPSSGTSSSVLNGL
jgi:hypothetical protein